MDHFDIEILIKAACFEAKEFIICGPKIETLLRKNYMANLNEGHKIEEGLVKIGELYYGKFDETKNTLDIYVDPYLDEDCMSILLDGEYEINLGNVDELRFI